MLYVSCVRYSLQTETFSIKINLKMVLLHLNTDLLIAIKTMSIDTVAIAIKVAIKKSYLLDMT